MLPYIAFRSDTKSYSVLYEHLSDMWLSTLEFGATQFYSCKEIAPKSPFVVYSLSGMVCKSYPVTANIPEGLFVSMDGSFE